MARLRTRPHWLLLALQLVSGPALLDQLVSSVTSAGETQQGASSGRSRAAGASTTAPKATTAIFTVTNTNDSGAGSLRQAVLDANGTAGADTITFSTFFDTPRTITLLSGELPINGSMSINGPGASLLTISGNSSSRIFNITDNVTVNLSGMTMTFGECNTNGGAILNGGTLSMTGSIISSSSADNGGGGIWSSEGSTLMVTGSNISGNTAALGGGIVSVGTLTLVDSGVNGNTAIVSDGGGILSFAMTVIHSAISGNHAPNGLGGGLVHYSFFNGVTSTVTDSTISRNTAGNCSGLFIDDFSTLTVAHSTISENIAGRSSGGICNNGTLTLSDSTISGNSTTIADGNGGGGGLYSYGDTGIISCTIAKNSATGANSAGGIYRDSGTVTLRSSIIAANVNNTTQPDVLAYGNTGVTSNGYNLVGNRGAVGFSGPGDQAGGNGNPILDPRLGPLQDNGGPTLTHALLFGSPALDGGNSTGSGLTTDQRGAGFSRVIDLPAANAGDGADIGAYEAQVPLGTGRVEGLLLHKAAGNVTLSWGPSCQATDTDYAIYEGTLGAFYSHASRFCSTGGAAAMMFTPAAGDTYYLVVALNGTAEGSYGKNSASVERPQGQNACLPQQIGSCP